MINAIERRLGTAPCGELGDVFGMRFSLATVEG